MNALRIQAIGSLSLAALFVRLAAEDPRLMKGEPTQARCPSCTRHRLELVDGRRICRGCGFFVRRETAR